MKVRIFFLFLASLSCTVWAKKKHRHRHRPRNTQPLLQKQPVFRNGIEIITSDLEEVVPYLQKYLPYNPVVVVASAYNGKATKKMAELWPQGKWYAFEPIAKYFVDLEKNTQALTNVERFQFALSDHTGITELYSETCDDIPNTPPPSALFLNSQEHQNDPNILFNTITPISAITLDDWADCYGVDHVDLLCLSLQGYELNIIKAAPKILKTVRAIYTEVSFAKTFEEQYLYNNVTEFLEGQGFKLAAQDFDEPPLFWYGNAVFVKKR